MKLELTSEEEAEAVCEFVNDLFRKRGHFEQVVEVIQADGFFGTFWDVKEIICEFPK